MKILVYTIFYILLLNQTSFSQKKAIQEHQNEDESSIGMRYDMDDIDIVDEYGNEYNPTNVPNFKKQIGSWSIVTGYIKGAKVCYSVSRPISSVGNNKSKNRNSYLIVLQKSENGYEINASSGYQYKKGSSSSISIDGRLYKFMNSDIYSWPELASMDNSILYNMLKSSRFSIKSESSIGTYSVDTYDLSDLSNVINTMNKICINFWNSGSQG
jgi:hypothetical protein